MTRREPLLAVLGALVSAGLLVWAAGAHWATGSGHSTGVAFVVRHASVTGRNVVPLLSAGVLVALAGAIAVPATRGWARLPVGIVVFAVGVATLVQTLARHGEPARRVLHALPAQASAHGNAWIVVAVLGSLLLTATGALIAVRGPGWRSMSGRYDAPASKAEARRSRESSPAGLWDAQDRGEDPTA